MTPFSTTTNIPVDDPFGVADDATMPWLWQALDPGTMQRRLDDGCARLAGGGQVQVLAIRVRRYKPGRRCLIAYDVALERPDAVTEAVTLLGKVRAKGLDNKTFHLHQALWNAGFDAACGDNVAVPAPVGMLPELNMWLQRQVPGVPATALLAGADGVALARRIAEAVHKLHCAGIPPQRVHTMADELHILHERLVALAKERPAWDGRLRRVLDACARLGASLPTPYPRGIHRDFYADQVIVDGERLCLIDLDLYCAGDPGLDIGNFVAHIAEQSLRTSGDPEALQNREAAMVERFIELAGEETRAAIEVYTTLTLARHIAISTQFPERRQYTEAVLALCERRLGIAM